MLSTRAVIHWATSIHQKCVLDSLLILPSPSPCKVSILSFYSEADWNSEWSNNIPVVMRLETGTGSASLKTPGLQRKKQHELSISSLFPRSGPYQGHGHGQRPFLPSSATCHPVGNRTDRCPEFQSLNSPNSPHEPPTLYSPSVLWTARIYLPTRSLAITSVHTPWVTNIATFSTIQQLSSPPTFLLYRG